MTLSDTGPLVAVIDESDQHHPEAKRLFNSRAFTGPLVTTEACVTETLFLLNKAGGWRAQDAMWRLIIGGIVRVHGKSEYDPERMRNYMARFRDQPCDYADATLLVTAEDTGLRQIVTFDRHFYAYRLTDGEALVVIS